jgi:hypothetical protein
MTQKIKWQASRIVTYPWHLKEKEVEDILSFFPKIQFKEEGGKANDYLDLFFLSKTNQQVGLRPYHLKNRQIGNKLSYGKARMMVQRLAAHPYLITDNMQVIIDESEFLKNIIGTKSMKLVPAGDNKEVAIVESTNDFSPLVQMETVKADIMENLLDKMQAVLHAITSGKIMRASPGTLSKMLSDMMKSYMMFKGETSPKSFLQININSMNLQQKRELSQKSSSESSQNKGTAEIRK